MSVSTRILELATALTNVQTRAAAARDVAHYLGATAFLVFLHDRELDKTFSAPGLPQTLPDDCAWDVFLKTTIAQGEHRDTLPLREGQEQLPALGITVTRDVVFVVAGIHEPAPQLQELRALLPLLSAALQAEHADATLMSEVSQIKSGFLATMSHELRTPLNAISGYVQLLQAGIYGPLSEPQQAALERVRCSQLHLLRLINDILSLTRIEAGGVQYHIADVQLNEAVREIVPLLQPDLADKHLEFSFITVPSDLTARVDPEKLQEVLLNLLSNATKFTAPGGNIRLTAGIDPDSEDLVMIEIEDSGAGIPRDKLEAIFQPFVQLDGGLTREHEGTGLGLAISRNLARGMNGDLAVRSEVGVGSVFTLKLPRATVPLDRAAPMVH